jgi:thiamine phosphate synthase YjbQ (UPF0047 family)
MNTPHPRGDTIYLDTPSARDIPIAEGTMLLGTWQQILHLECDGGRQRTVVVTVVRET